VIEKDKLKEYHGKRDFSKTPEPRAGSRKSVKQPIFVIQQHDASRMHFDFRLEVDGVLASWAVPKGPSTDPREKRLAIRTEDHPLEYADFEGRIPEDEYGGGVVIVWDTGGYENMSRKNGRKISLRKALEKGSAKVKLHGEKLKGGYALIHTKTGGDEKNWLLVKEDDDDADARRNPVSSQPQSVLSGKTIKEMAEAIPAASEGDR
jgi:DNA ligase D-like protein (predicted 3'-phosphoesterase)